MTIEDRIRLTAHGKVRVFISGRKRAARGFTIAWNHEEGTGTLTYPSKRIALQHLLAIVRCQPARAFILKPAK